MSNGENNIVILGDAGSGKSTLLRYIFAFDQITQCRSLYITAKDAQKEDGILNHIKKQTQNSNESKYLIFIDGVDEAFHNDYSGFESFVSELKQTINCRFWIGCRTDFYARYYSENISFAAHNYKICTWSDQQIETFIDVYSNIRGNPQIKSFVDKLTCGNDTVNKLKANPFQLALIVFLAENSEDFPITGVYDLYERFMQKWVDKEQKRGTCSDSNVTILKKLREIAKDIYNNQDVVIDDVLDNNTAISDLLIINKTDIYNKRYATAFCHRSLAAFLLAQQTVEIFLKNDVSQIINVLSGKLKDDVTNFVGDKFTSLSYSEKNRIKNNLQSFYSSVHDKNIDLSIEEQIVYYITRLGLDVTDFLVKIVRSNPQQPIMRLTLAYGCVLSENDEARSFALAYAKSIADETIDAVINRAWTVVYFGDINRDPYTYLDNEKCSWSNARAARMKRFTKKDPRKKDYRFRLFDIPLFYSFLNDRGWNDVSAQEYSVLKAIEFPLGIFNSEEISFLNEQREKLLIEYAKHLKSDSVSFPE